MVIECDVLVVGAGPAGSSAARAASEAGAHTVFIDKKKEIGVPVQCAEAIGKVFFPFLPFRIPKDQLIWKLDDVFFRADGITIKRTGGPWSSYVLNRKDFDKWLANNAVKNRAKLLANTELIKLEVGNDYNVKKATVKTPEGEKQIKTRVVIAADGVDSTVLKLLGFKIDKKTTCGKVISFEMKNLNLSNPHSFQVFLGDFAPGAYAYILPKSKTVANVGAGTIFQKKKVEKCYEEFLDIPLVKKQLKDGEEVIEKSGWAPIRYLADKWVYGNVFLVGDAATQNFKPFIEGILPGIICGNVAGKTAYNFINGRDSLSNYPNHVRDKLGTFFLESNHLINLLYMLGESSDKKEHLIRLGLFANIFSFKQIEKLENENYITIKKILEDWNRSKIRQILTHTSERLGFCHPLITKYLMR